ncbi:MAG: hypothetical protein GX864_00235 [Mollicutes bacterium]|nr:hypothetical protein [Mollicutes bacterium]
MKKNKSLLIILIIIIIIFIYILYKPTNYQKKYLVDDYNVSEKYDGIYHIQINKNNLSFNYAFDKKYSPFRNIVKKINTYVEDNYYCIDISVAKVRLLPLCYQGQKTIDFRLIDTQKFKQFVAGKYNISKTYINTTIDKYNILTSDTSNYAIWNYKGIDFISREKLEKIPLFEKDIYDNSLVYKTDNYLFIPNYNLSHNFNEIIIIDMRNGESKKIGILYEISYESYINGHFGDKLYLVDKKEKVQYEIDLIKKEINIISTDDGLGKNYNDKWEDITINRLVNNEIIFSEKTRYEYLIKDNHLFIKDNLTDNLIQISYLDSPKIIQKGNDYIYYVHEDVLYKYSLNYGEVEIMKNYEWKFNSDNKIFVK